MSLVKIKVRITRRDQKDADKEVSKFEDYLLNPKAVDCALSVPGTETIVAKIRGGDSILVKSTLKDFAKACGE
jgi:hypothetical protein